MSQLRPLPSFRQKAPVWALPVCSTGCALTSCLQPQLPSRHRTNPPALPSSPCRSVFDCQTPEQVRSKLPANTDVVAFQVSAALRCGRCGVAASMHACCAAPGRTANLPPPHPTPSRPLQCRNPIHRAHYELFIRALDAPNVAKDGAVLVHPTCGPTQVVWVGWWGGWWGGVGVGGGGGGGGAAD